MSAPFDYDELAEAGLEKVVVRYSGENDESYIQDVESEQIDFDAHEHHDLFRAVEGAAYDLLEKEWGGWEINEGSSGTITINVKERTTELKHGENVVTQNWSTKEFRDG